jgi:hypothetical protein
MVRSEPRNEIITLALEAAIVLKYIPKNPKGPNWQWIISYGLFDRNGSNENVVYSILNEAASLPYLKTLSDRRKATGFLWKFANSSPIALIT